MEKLTLTGFLLRMLAAFALVFVTFNPSGYSYSHWVADQFPRLSALQAVLGVLLLIGWVIFAVATLRSIGRTGVLLIAVLFAALTWLLFSIGWISWDRKHAIGWIALAALAVTLGMGLSWQFINRKLTGQIDVDPVEPP